MRNQTVTIKRSLIFPCLLLALPALAHWSCSNPATTQSNASVILEINGGGCNVVATLDNNANNNAATETGSGSFTLWTNIATGSHSVSISAPPYGSGVCNFNFTGSSHVVTLVNACSSGFQITCN